MVTKVSARPSPTLRGYGLAGEEAIPVATLDRGLRDLVAVKSADQADETVDLLL